MTFAEVTRQAIPMIGTTQPLCLKLNVRLVSLILTDVKLS